MYMHMCITTTNLSGKPTLQYLMFRMKQYLCVLAQKLYHAGFDQFLELSFHEHECYNIIQHYLPSLSIMLTVCCIGATIVIALPRVEDNEVNVNINCSGPSTRSSSNTRNCVHPVCGNTPATITAAGVNGMTVSTIAALKRLVEY